MTEPTRPCGTCGMPCTPGEYHPYAACLMFKACHNSETVRANLEAVRGTPPAVAGEPVAWMGTYDKTDLYYRKPPQADVVPLYTTPQPTQAQAETPCRKNPFYHGPRNCSRGTVGCCEDHGVNTHPQAGAVPLTPEKIAEIADAAHREYDRLVASGQCAPRWSAVFAHFLEQHHGIGIKGGQHGL